MLFDTLNSFLSPLLKQIVFVLVLQCIVFETHAQEGSTIPPSYRGEDASEARGVFIGNLIETNFRNMSEIARVGDIPWSNWPRGIGSRHVDGIVPLAAGPVPGRRAEFPAFYGGAPDTTLNPVIVNMVGSFGFGRKVVDDTTWGWLPLPGFLNNLRRSPITGQREPVPAISDDDSSWPEFWPDRLENPDDPGWPGSWNGFFGKGVFNADLEAYFVMDDYSDFEYRLDPLTGRPNSQFGVFYPDPSDRLKGGFGFQMALRLFAWGNVLAEDAIFIIHRVTNTSATNYDQIYFSQMVDYGLGWEEGDENAAFDPLLDVAYGYDQDGIGTLGTGGTYALGYTGIAYLESPVQRNDGQDNDDDGITDEGRFSGPGILIEGQENIRSYVEANYNLEAFEQFNGTLETRPAYRIGYWWTGDENMDWEPYLDENGNGLFDRNEVINDDVGQDGLGPNELNYPGPDTGEGDGIPSIREPDFDQTDIDEGDQVGLTGFSLEPRGIFTAGDNMRNDTWLWARILEAEDNIVLGETRATAIDATSIEPWVTFTSGPTALSVQQTDFFSTAWLFGFNLDDFLRNRRVVQRIYNSDYRFAQPPLMPLLNAKAGDGFVALSWDTTALASFDRFTQEFDFEGFKIYKGTDPLLSDSRTITDANGAPTFYEPIAQFDYVNDIKGTIPVQDNNVIYDLGDDTGLQFSYIDHDVVNGKTYYYAVVAYDRGFDPNDGTTDRIDPQENIFKIDVDAGGTIRGTSRNAAVIVPRSNAAGYTSPFVNEDLSRVTAGIGTGSIDVLVTDPDVVDPNALYRITFFDEISPRFPERRFYRTAGYEVSNLNTQQVIVPRRELPASNQTVIIDDALTINIFNDEPVINLDRTGWVENVGTPGNRFSEQYAYDPADLGQYQTNWIVDSLFIEPDHLGPAGTNVPVLTPFDFELAWVDPADSLFQTIPFRIQDFLFTRLPIFGVNASTGETVGVFVEDLNDNGEWDVEDLYHVGDRVRNEVVFYYGVKFRLPPGAASIPPEPGAVLRMSSSSRPFASGDYFDFSMKAGGIDLETASGQLDQIAVVPNPYVGAAEWEERTQVTGRGPRRIQFINLPEKCVIKIFTIRGELVRELVHDGFGGDGAKFWDLKTSNNQDVAYGVYLYHVEAEGIGEHVGKFAIIK